MSGYQSPLSESLWLATDGELLTLRDSLELQLDMVREVINVRAFQACTVPASGGQA